MAFPYKLHSQAIDEYANGYEWYENNVTALAKSFWMLLTDRLQISVKIRDTTAGYVAHTDKPALKNFRMLLCTNFFHAESLSTLLPYSIPAEIQRKNSERKNKPGK